MKTAPICTLTDPNVRQCCCACRSHLTDAQHGATYICAPPEFAGGYYSQWPAHSVGCELFTESRTEATPR
mgnify:CR=1 FL=1